jgi:hypothetical protein
MTLAPIVTTSAPSVSTTDVKVCTGVAGLGERGKGFYPTYKQLMQTQGRAMTMQPIELSAQLAVLTTVAAEENQIDGSAIINQASPDVRLAVTKMTRDADRLAQHYADVAQGGLAGNSDLTPIVNSFTGALIACAKAGYQPSWFNPQELNGG